MPQPLISSWQALILGIVEGVTEFLPISSTGHLIITSHLLGLDNPTLTGEQIQALQAFEIIIQSGAILAVVVLYRAYLMDMMRGLLGASASGKSLAFNIIVATVPVLVVGFLLKSVIETYLHSLWFVIAALGVGGVLMIAIEFWLSGRRAPKGTLKDVSKAQALLIGAMQCLALWPGTSRSMVTIVGGMLTGLSRPAAAEFSFLLGLPSLLAASLYKGYKHGPVLMQHVGIEAMAIAFITSAVVAGLAIKLFVAFLNRKGLSVFGVYRIFLALALAYGF